MNDVLISMKIPGGILTPPGFGFESHLCSVCVWVAHSPQVSCLLQPKDMQLD